MKRNFTGERGRKRLFAFVLTFCMVVCGFEMYVPTSAVKAEEQIPATEGTAEQQTSELVTEADPPATVTEGDITYTYDSESKKHVYKATGSSYTNVTIPAGCMFEITSSVEITENLTIKAGGELTIINSRDNNGNVTGTGKLTFGSSATVSAENGASMMLESEDNKPTTGMMDIRVSDSAVILSWAAFEYDETDSAWKQIVISGPNNEVEVVINGIKGATFNFYYRDDPANAWTEIVNDTPENVMEYSVGEDTAFIRFDPGFVGDLHIMLVVTTKVIAYAAQGENGPADPIKDILKDGGTLDGNRQTLNYTVDPAVPKKDLHFALAYDKEGDPSVKAKIEDTFYAYSDLDGSGTVDVTDIQRGLATELCARYFDGKVAGGAYGGMFEINSPADLEGRITVTADGTYTAVRKDGSNATLNKYKFSIALGTDPDGKPVNIEEGAAYAYALENPTDILVSTGSAFHIRNVATDAVDFDAKEGINDPACCVCAEYDNTKLRINGNGGGNLENINPDGDDVFCVMLSMGSFAGIYNNAYGGSLSDYSGNNKLRIMKPSKTYVIVDAEGETKQVDGINNTQVDNVCQTGTAYEKKYSEVFVGNSAIHIHPINPAVGLATSAIANVELKDKTITDGVKLTKAAADDYKVEFLSNYYDSVTLVITFTDGKATELTIKRIGLIINKPEFLVDGETTFTLFHGGQPSGVNVSYNYNAGEQIIVYATYYHPTNDRTSSGSDDLSLFLTYADGSTKVLKKYQYTPAAATKVATTDFIIGFTAAKKWDGNVWLVDPTDKQMPAFSAIVLNSGYNSTTKFGGTQIGSDRGVYWDGKIAYRYN